VYVNFPPDLLTFVPYALSVSQVGIYWAFWHY
jgi:hypothetical protein